MQNHSFTVRWTALNRHDMLSELTSLSWALHRLGLEHNPVTREVGLSVDRLAEQPTWPPRDLELLDGIEDLMVHVDTVISSEEFLPLDTDALDSAVHLSESVLDRVGALQELAGGRPSGRRLADDLKDAA